jgi:3-hydroxyisobutyrate dehydrogenase-like beta-hydroxyacid dehydrogenase
MGVNETRGDDPSAGGTLTNVGFVGVGHMGGPMARRLLACGFAVTVVDSRPEAVAECSAHGATVADSLSDLAAACDVALICVTNAPQVESVVDALVKSPNHRIRLIGVHSTITPELSVVLDERAKERGIVLVDAPVSGNLEARADGTLAMMIGGTREDLKPFEDVFAALSSNRTMAGRIGGGSGLKLINNVLSLLQIMSLSEARRLGAAYGLDDAALRDAIEVASGDCYALRNLDYFVNFPIGHPLGGNGQAFYEFMRKDLLSALDSASQNAVELPFVEAAASIAPQVYENFWHLEDHTKEQADDDHR